VHAPCDASAKYCTVEFLGEQLTHVDSLGLTTDGLTWDGMPNLILISL
jgi:hypothetical protein